MQTKTKVSNKWSAVNDVICSIRADYKMSSKLVFDVEITHDG